MHQPALRLLSGRASLIAALLLVGTVVLLVHHPALNCRALGPDDEEYLFENLRVQNPSVTNAALFLREVRTPSTVRGYYQPLSMISLMLDSAMSGSPENLAPFRRTSLLLHVTNALVVVLLLYLLFGDVASAAVAGLLFGLHPMTVETLPWLAERKTLLATLFSLLSVLAYLRYVRRQHYRWLVVCTSSYVLALLSKPISTPLPVALLLLDIWPLRRFGNRAILEKVPLFLLAVVSAATTYISQRSTAGAALPTSDDPLYVPLVLCHVLVFYLGKLCWPTHLTPQYAFPELTIASQWVSIASTIIILSAVALSTRRSPVPIVGLMFFLVMLLPASGVIGFAGALTADRHVYLPMLGLLLVLAWALRSLGEVKWKPLPLGTSACGVGLLVAAAFGILARQQYTHWKNTETLCAYMISLAPQSAVPYNGYGNELQRQGRLAEAIRYYEEALRLEPNSETAHYNVANWLLKVGRSDEAIEYFRKALELAPEFPEANNNLAATLLEMGRGPEALPYCERAVQLQPASWIAHRNLGVSLALSGSTTEAIGVLQRTLELNPYHADTHRVLGDLYRATGLADEANAQYHEAFRLDSQDPEIRARMEPP